MKAKQYSAVILRRNKWTTNHNTATKTPRAPHTGGLRAVLVSQVSALCLPKTSMNSFAAIFFASVFNSVRSQWQMGINERSTAAKNGRTQHKPAKTLSVELPPLSLRLSLSLSLALALSRGASVEHATELIRLAKSQLLSSCVIHVL